MGKCISRTHGEEGRNIHMNPKVEIYKVDAKGNNIPGVHLRVSDGERKIVQEWVSGNEPLVLELEEGVYTVTEIVSPQGAAEADAMAFTVDSTPSYQVVEYSNSIVNFDLFSLSRGACFLGLVLFVLVVLAVLKANLKDA